MNNDTDNTIFICINYDEDGQIKHLELLSEQPKFEGFDHLMIANINGGDSRSILRRI